MNYTNMKEGEIKSEEIRVFLDVMGEPILEGDIVYRSVYSSLSIHKVIRQTNKSIILSCKRFEYDDNRLGKFTISVRTKSLDTLEDHNSTIRVKKYIGDFIKIKKAT